MPNISDIPTASALHLQLESINKAIAALKAGSSITNLTTSAPPPDPEDPTAFQMPVMVLLDPPISNSTTLGELSLALEAQADLITQQLVNAGYIDA